MYAGLVPDYTGAAVSAEIFFAVLAGDAAAVQGKGSGKVIASGPRDRVFLFFSDHGAPGVLGMPSGGRGTGHACCCLCAVNTNFLSRTEHDDHVTLTIL